MSEAQLPPGSEEMAGDELNFARLMRKANSTPGAPGGAEGEDGEFTVKLLKVREAEGEGEAVLPELVWVLTLIRRSWLRI